MTPYKKLNKSPLDCDITSESSCFRRKDEGRLSLYMVVYRTNRLDPPVVNTRMNHAQGCTQPIDINARLSKSLSRS